MVLEKRSIDISGLNFEDPPEGQVLTEEILRKTVVTERGETGPLGTLCRAPDLENKIWFVPMDLTIPNPGQPRKDFGEEEMERLKTALLSDGQKSPALTVPLETAQGMKVLIEDGGRRHRGIDELGGRYLMAKMGFQRTFHAIFEAGAITNLTNKAHNPMEEAEIFDRSIKWRIEADGMNQEQALQDVANTYGMKLSYVKKRLSLLELPETYQRMIVAQGLDPTKALDTYRRAQKAGINNHTQVAMALLQVNRRTESAGQRTSPTDLSGISVETIHEALKKAAEQTGDGESTIRVEELRAAEALSLFVSSVGTTKQRLQRLFDPETLKHAVKIFSNRQGVPPDEAFLEIDELLGMIRTAQSLVVRPGAERGRHEGEKNPIAILREVRDSLTKIIDEVGASRGFPPQAVEGSLKELVSSLEQFSNQAVIPALSIPPLKILEGSPSFKAHIGSKIQKILQKDNLRYKIVEILAETSDNQGQAVSVREIAEKLRSQGIEQTPQQILNHIVAMDTILRAQGLRVDSHVKFNRSKETRELTRILCYRLAWLPVKKQ